MHFAPHLQPPYYAVIFTSQLSNQQAGYNAAAQRMVELAQTQPGYLGAESVRNAQGFGITVSYWQDEQSIQQWREHTEHRLIQEEGKSRWYEHFELRVAKVERASAKST